MIIQEDTRQQSGKHKAKHGYFEVNDIDVIRSKLPYGDYCKPPAVAVDTKQGIHEIAVNLCGAMSERARVREECKLAKMAGAELIFLIEDGAYTQPSDLIGKEFHLLSGKTVSGQQLYLAMQTMSARYGCRFEFCPPSEAGRRIVGLLSNGEE